MTIFKMPFMLLNGGPQFKFDEAVSFQVATDDQAETDRYWNAIVDNGGRRASAVGARTSSDCRGRSRRGA